MMVGLERSNKLNGEKRPYKAIRKYASFVNGETSVCGSPIKKFKLEEEETDAGRVIGKLRVTEDFINYVCYGFNTEMAKELLLKDLHMPHLEGEFSSCNTPPDSLSGLKACTQPTNNFHKDKVKVPKHQRNKKESLTFKSKISGKRLLRKRECKDNTLKQSPTKCNFDTDMPVLKKINIKISHIDKDWRAHRSKQDRKEVEKRVDIRRGGKGVDKDVSKRVIKGVGGGLKHRLRASTRVLTSAMHNENILNNNETIPLKKQLVNLNAAKYNKLSTNGIINKCFKSGKYDRNVDCFHSKNDGNSNNTDNSNKNNNNNNKNNSFSHVNNNNCNNKNVISHQDQSYEEESEYNSDENQDNGLHKVDLFMASVEDFKSIPLLINKLCQQQQPLYHVCPPSNFKVECSVPQQTRFSTHNQYVHRFSNRWGHNSLQLACITAHLDNQQAIFNSHPLVGGVEVDLVGLMEAINTWGGLQNVIDKALWSNVVASMHVPKNSRDKVSRFYEIYCRHLLSYDTLSSKDKLKLLRGVRASMFSEHSDDLCVSKGRCRNLSEFYASARNVSSMMEMEDAPNHRILSRYWKVVEDTSPHLSVNTAFIKPSDVNNGRKRRSFRSRTDITSMMRCCNDGLCPLFADEEVIDSRLEVEMMFSSRCWSRDQHSRGLIAYNHTGADVVWYCIRGEDEAALQTFLTSHAPQLINHQSAFWLPPNHIMVSPKKLLEGGVRVVTCTQQAGHMVIIPPLSFFSSVSCGYSISEHAHFLPHDWLLQATIASKSLHRSRVVPMFSMHRFLVSLLTREIFIHEKQQQINNNKQPQSQQQNSPQLKRHLSEQQLKQAFNLMNQAVTREIKLRKVLSDMGVKRRVERVVEGGLGGGGVVVGSDSFMSSLVQHKLSICTTSKAFCFFSKIQDNNSSYCIDCAFERLQEGAKTSNYEMIIYFSHSELQELLTRIRKTFNLPKDVSTK